MAYKKLKYWFDQELAQMLADKISVKHPEFPSAVFVQYVATRVDRLELKDRVECIADMLRYFLPSSYRQSLHILLGILGPDNPKETGMFTEGYWIMPIAKFVEKYGLDDFNMSMKAIRTITKRNTGEYAVRPYLRLNTEHSLQIMTRWATDRNFHVRRLASEGIRPRLPWATKLDLFIQQPQMILPILEILKDDESKYVQKSVANNLNDILKDNYTIAIEYLQSWVENATPQRRWIIKHALRNELKKENPEALALLEHLKN